MIVIFGDPWDRGHSDSPMTPVPVPVAAKPEKIIDKIAEDAAAVTMPDDFRRAIAGLKGRTAPPVPTPEQPQADILPISAELAAKEQAKAAAAEKEAPQNPPVDAKEPKGKDKIVTTDSSHFRGTFY